MLTWILGVAAGTMVVALLLYFVAPARSVKVSAVVLGIVGGLATGGILGMLAAIVYGEAIRDRIAANESQLIASATAQPAPAKDAAPAKDGAPAKKAGGGMGKAEIPSTYPGMDQMKKSAPSGAGPGGGMGGGLFGRGPSPKAQLASLVSKLDQLTRKPLTLSLDEDHRAKVREQLQGLGDAAELKDDQAQKRLDTLLDLVKDQRETLEAAGYRWPGTRFTPPTDSPNPFKDEAQGKHLTSLLDTLGKDTSKP